jgi:Uma2 family endonuclease
MSALAADKRTWTPEEYLARERASSEKHAFYRGEVFAMAGASREHNLIVGNIVRLLGNALLDRPCESYPSDMRVRIVATGLYTYPDATALCQRPVFDDSEADTLMNPEVIFEVLSESTEAYDRGDKFDQYRSIPSFNEYVLVSQDKILVEHFVRQADSSWNLRLLRKGDGLVIPSLGCVLAVEEMYRKVFEAGASG